MAKKKDVDAAVLGLLKQVEKKKLEIKKAKKKPQWKTNCTIGYDPESPDGRVNIMTVRSLPKILDLTAFLLQRKQLAEDAAKVLGVDPNFEYMAYLIDEWIDDLKTRAGQLTIEQKQKELEELDKRVNKLVSPDQRREMELEALEALVADA